MRIRGFFLIILTMLLNAAALFAQKADFNADSAYAYTKFLSVTIGPRPMGSHNEQRALRWAAGKFKAFGADTAYVMPFYESPRGVNTSSGVAVGIFRGLSDSTIVIGGHIDSDSRINPGASDNASGAACVIELARDWSKSRPETRRYTLLFATFGGEERGLIGSKYFAKHYPKMNDVALMFSIDMAGTEGWLIPFIDTNTHQSPEWLVEDAFAFDRVLGYDDLEYPTHFFSINNAMGGAGSDHLPFLNKGIPAIDFTAGINIDPIHTPRDQFKFVKKPMLARSGRLVDGMLKKYQQNGIPKDKEDHYMLWETFVGRLYLPYWLLIAANILAGLMGFGALLQARKFREKNVAGPKARFSGLKLFALMIIIALFTQGGEAAMQLLKGFRYPWMTYFDKYLVYAAIFSVAGLWVGVQLTRVWRFSADPYKYIVRAIVLLLIYIVLLSFAGARLAFYPALTLLMLFVIANVNYFPLQFIFSLLAPLPMLRLAFMEVLPFIARTLTQLGFVVATFWHAAIYTAILTALLTLWFLPSLFIFAYLIRNNPAGNAFAQQFRKPLVGVILLLIVAGYGGYLYGLPAFSERWKPIVRLTASYFINSGKSEVKLSSNEFLHKVHVKADGFERGYNGEKLAVYPPLTFEANWFSVAGKDSLAAGEEDTIFVDWQFRTKRPWYRVVATIRSDTSAIDVLVDDLNYAKKGNGVRFQWVAEPPDSLAINARFIVPHGANLTREIKGIYPFTPTPVSVTSELAPVIYETEVTFKDTLRFENRRQ